MNDLIDPIVIPVDSSQTVTASKDLNGLGLAYAKMVQTVLYENKVLSAAKKASASVVEEAEARTIQKQIAEEQKLTAAKAKEVAKQQALAEKQIQDEENARFASIRKQISMMENSKRLDNSLQVKALKEETAERERVAAAAKREADQLEYLNMKYDKAYAAAKLYKSVQDEINLAMSKGVGNADQLQAQLNKLEMEYAAFGAGTTDIKNRFVQQAAAVEESRKGVNKWGLLVQQTGYQAGDFLVQLQSGTNVFVAFGQQATQLVGILPMFATELGVSAVALGGITLGLSIAIPLITAVGAYFMRSGDGANKASKDIDLYTQAVSALASEIQKNQDKFNLINFGGSQTTANANAAKQAIEDQIKGVEKQISSEEDLLRIQAQGGVLALSYAATRSIINSLTLKSLDDQRQDLIIKLDLLDAQSEAQRMLNGGLSVAGGLQRVAVRDKQEQLRLAKEQAIAEQTAADKATFLKNVFHAMAGEAGAVSTSLDGWAGKIIAATEAAKNFKPMDYSGFTYGGAFAEGRGAGGAGMIPTNEGTVVKDKTATGTGGGGGMDKVQALLDSLQTQTEVTDAWYEESQKTLQSASDKELEILGGKEEAKLRLLNDYRQKQYEAQQAQSQLLYQSQAGMYGALGDLLSQFGTKSKGAAVAALAIQKGLSIAQIIANTAAAQMRALAELGPIAGSAMAAKIGLMGKLQVGLVAATGLMQAGSIMSGGASGGGGSGNGRNSVETSANNMQTAAPQVVMIQGLKPTDVFTGEQLSTLFDSLYKENRNRGMVFQVAR